MAASGGSLDQPKMTSGGLPPSRHISRQMAASTCADAHAARNANHFELAFALDLHQRVVVKVAGVAERGLDENDGRRGIEAVFEPQRRVSFGE